MNMNSYNNVYSSQWQTKANTSNQQSSSYKTLSPPAPKKDDYNFVGYQQEKASAPAQETFYGFGYAKPTSSVKTTPFAPKFPTHNVAYVKYNDDTHTSVTKVKPFEIGNIGYMQQGVGGLKNVGPTHYSSPSKMVLGLAHEDKIPVYQHPPAPPKPEPPKHYETIAPNEEAESWGDPHGSDPDVKGNR